MKYIFLLSPLFLFFLVIPCKSQTTKTMLNTNTVKEFELNKYLGTWYEIARYPHSFEKNLVGVTATYSLRDDGKINVLNQGYLNTLDGKLKTARGKAKIPDPSEPAKLKVSFFLFFYGDYYILELDPDYQWAMIGSSSPNYFWILSCTPVLPDTILDKLMKNAEQRGYDLDRIVMVPQPETE